MMSNSIILLALILFSFTGGLPQCEAHELAVDRMIDGKHIKIPWYDDKIRELPKARIEFDLARSAEIKALVNNGMYDLLVKNKSEFAMLPYAYKLYKFYTSMLKKYHKLIKDGETGPELDPQIFTDNINFVIEILGKAKQAPIEELDFGKQAKEEKMEALNRPLTKEEMRNLEVNDFIARVRDLMRLIDDVILNNPTGIYLNWQQLTIDDVPLLDIVLPFLSYLKKDGRSFMLSVIETGARLMAKVMI